jgi:hypothetical protein
VIILLTWQKVVHLELLALVIVIGTVVWLTIRRSGKK